MLVFTIFAFFVLQNTCTGNEEARNDFHKAFERVQREIDAKHAELRKNNEHEFHLKVAEESARFILNFLDVDKKEKLDRDEMIRFGKLAVSNDTESAETYAEVTLQADKDGDGMLDFNEFHQPRIEYGESSAEGHDEKHQHKEGHGYENDPKTHHKHNDEL